MSSVFAKNVFANAFVKNIFVKNIFAKNNNSNKWNQIISTKNITRINNQKMYI